jgi:hypothetical protein
MGRCLRKQCRVPVTHNYVIYIINATTAAVYFLDVNGLEFLSVAALISQGWVILWSLMVSVDRWRFCLQIILY